MPDLDELLEFEHAGWRALCEGTGAVFYAAAMPEDGRMIVVGGMSLGRDETVAALNDAPPWSGYEIDEPRLLGLGEGAAVLLYRGRAWRTDDGTSLDALMASTYVRTPEGWRLALYQQTPVDEAG
jgi:hypothetical protein